MNLDMWFRDDIANVLAGIVTAVRHSGSNQSPEWQQGFLSGIAAVTASFGINPAAVTGGNPGDCTVTKIDGPFRAERDGNTVRLRRVV